MSMNPNIPQAPDKLKASQPVLLSNNLAMNAIFGRNHYEFSLNNDTKGKQKFLEILKSAAIPNPVPGLIAGEGTIYTKSSAIVADGATPPTNAFYTPDNSGNEYQFIRSRPDKYPKFASACNIKENQAGWTFLPGGILLLYGTIKENKDNQKIVNFANLGLPDFQSPSFNIQVTRSKFTNSKPTSNFSVSALSALTNIGFVIHNYDGGSWAYYWTAIGI